MRELQHSYLLCNYQLKNSLTKFKSSINIQQVYCHYKCDSDLVYKLKICNFILKNISK